MRCALKVAPLVLLRPGELRFAEWTEIDLDQALWTVPAAPDALHDLVGQRRHGGMPIDDVGHRREAFNLAAAAAGRHAWSRPTRERQTPQQEAVPRRQGPDMTR